MVRITTETSQGSGFFVHAQGLIITSNHVVEESTEVTVELADGRLVDGTIVGRHFAGDVAIISVEPVDVPVLPLGDSDALAVGDPIIKVGYALGVSGEPTSTTGVMSARRTDERLDCSYIQTDAAINPGDSGGPLLNEHGEVVGINAAKYVGLNVEGMGLALAINEVKDSISGMASGQNVCQPYPALQEGSTYTDSNFKWKITLPRRANWETVELDDGSRVLGHVPNFKPGHRTLWFDHGVFIWSPFTRGSTESLSEFFDSIIGAWSENWDVEVLSRRRVCIPVDGVDQAIEADVLVSRGDKDEYRERWLLFHIGAQAYFIEGLSWTELWETTEPYIDTVFYTFGF